METIHILLVEDNDGDIMLTTEALEETNRIVNVSVVKDGKEAIDFLNTAYSLPGLSLPDLLLLDVNMPRMNGHEVLKYVKESEQLKHIPVIMFTTSSSQKEINRAYMNYANCFITKPVDGDDFIRVINSIVNFWFSIVKLPTNKTIRYEQQQ